MDNKYQPERSPPTYEQTVHGGPSAAPSRPAATSGGQTHMVYGPGAHGPDVMYIKSVCGIAKIIQAVVCLLGFIIDLTVGYPGSGFTSFSTINGFIQAVIWFVLHLMHAIPQIFGNYYIELIMCAILDLFLFISAIVAAASGWMHPSIGAVSFFCFGATAAYTVDSVLQALEVRRKIAESRAQQPDVGSFEN